MMSNTEADRYVKIIRALRDIENGVLYNNLLKRAELILVRDGTLGLYDDPKQTIRRHKDSDSELISFVDRRCL